MKTYEVIITAGATVVVTECENEAEALEFAEGISYGDFRHIESEARELTTPEAIDAAKRHADEVLEP